MGGGCVISLNNSWRITVVVRPKILTVSTTYPISSNNKKRVNHKLMTHPLSLLKRKLEEYGLACRVLPPLLPSLSRIDR